MSDPLPPAEPARAWPGRLCPALAVATVLIHLLYVLYRPTLNHDVAALLSIGQLIARGAVPYADIGDFSPPLIHYLSAIPAWISLRCGLDLAATGLLWFTLVVLALGGLSLRLLPAAVPGIRRSERCAFLVVWVGFSLHLYFRSEFAQRDQLFFCAASSWVLLRHIRHAGRPVGRATAVLVGLCMAAGVAMKPHYLLSLTLAELALLLAHRTLRPRLLSPEVVAAAGFSLLFLLHFFLVPGMDAFFGYWVDFGLRGYGAYGDSAVRVLREFFYQRDMHVLCGTLLTLLVAGLGREPATRAPVLAVGALAAGALANYVLAAKGFEYHQIVFKGALLLGLFLLLQRAAARVFAGPGPGARDGAALLGILLMLSTCTPSLAVLSSLVARGKAGPALAFPETPTTRLIRGLTRPDDRVLFVTASVPAAFPDLTYTGRPHGGRFVCSYPLAFFFGGTNGRDLPPRWAEDERLYIDGLLADIRRYNPALVFIDLYHGGWVPAEFQTLEYLESRGVFAEGGLRNYQRIGVLPLKQPVGKGIVVLARPGTPGARANPVVAEMLLSGELIVP